MVGLTTSRQIWQALETSFASQSKAKAMQYKMQFQNIKDSLPIIEYLGKIKRCCDLLAAIGCKISEDDQILYALNGLGPQYDPVMVAISARVDGWTMQEVSSLLMSFETRLEGSKSSSSHINVDGSISSLNLTQMPAFRREVSPAPSSNT
ncbi:uncharacterized protein LOC121777788 [Salvia splendens]|uniref:uncharacterized protein LOC121777788 n=1 Tax=Salvia splendens TaxID=180675 RepID=UPI001C25A2EC|nr:uncharacterized protein LOC121777788 [Salvia splendens]